MLRLTLLALAISVLSYVIEYLLIFHVDIFGTYFMDRRVTFVFYMVMLMPPVEEAVRVNVVRQAERLGWLDKLVSLRTAILLGALIGLCEWVAKSISLEPRLTTRTIIALIVNLSSFPIHIALSCAFFSFQSERFVKTMALHILTNLSILAVAVTLTARGWDNASLAYVLTMMATVITVSALVAWRPIWVFRRSSGR